MATRKNLEEQLAKDKAALEALRADYKAKQAALEKAIKAKEQKYNAQYNSKRTHMLCTTAPILLSAMGLREDGSLQKLKEIEDIIKNLTDEQKQMLAQILQQ